MSVLLKKIIWRSVKQSGTSTIGGQIVYNDPVPLTGIESFTAVKGLTIKNNILTLNLKNEIDFSRSNSVSGFAYKYVDELGNLKFKEQDKFTVYVGYSDDASDTSSTTWSNSSDYVSSTPDNRTYLLGEFYLIEYQLNHGENGQKLTLKCADKTYIVFNKVFSKPYPSGTITTAPQIVQDVIRLTCQGGAGEKAGTGRNKNVKYHIEVKLFSEGIVDSGTTNGTTANKLVQIGKSFTSTVTAGDMVRNTTDETYAEVTAVDSNTVLSLSADIMVSGEGYQISDGFIQDTRPDGTAFPATDIALQWKPVYDWITELSQIDKTNPSGELSVGTDTVVQKPMIFWVDELNRFHWVYPGSITNTTITSGRTTGLINNNMGKKVFDATNMIIFNCGKDMYEVGIWYYYYDSSSDVSSVKMSYRPMTDIAQGWIRKDYDKGTPASGRNGTPAGDPFPQFPASYPVTPQWSTSSVANDAEYNSTLRTACKNDGVKRAQGITSKIGTVRWKGNVEFKGAKFIPGSLIRFTDLAVGMNNVLLRIMNVSHTINKEQWVTTLELEEDPLAIKRADR